jgi:hypothetical protein
MAAAYTKGAISNIPLKLGWVFRPVWSSGPNTHFRPGVDSHDILKDSVPHKSSCSIWHTLSIDAGALITLWTPGR